MWHLYLPRPSVSETRASIVLQHRICINKEFSLDATLLYIDLNELETHNNDLKCGSFYFNYLLSPVRMIQLQLIESKKSAQDDKITVRESKWLNTVAMLATLSIQWKLSQIPTIAFTYFSVQGRCWWSANFDRGTSYDCQHHTRKNYIQNIQIRHVSTSQPVMGKYQKILNWVEANCFWRFVCRFWSSWRSNWFQSHKYTRIVDTN